MADIKVFQEITLDFAAQKYVVVKAKQADRSSRYLRITTTIDGTNYHWDNALYGAFLRVRRPDGGACLGMATITSDGKIETELTELMLGAEGTCQADLCITTMSAFNIKTDLDINYSPVSGGVLTTLPFNIYVIKGSVTGATIVEGEYDRINDFLLRMTKNWGNTLSTAQSYMNSAKSYSEAAEGYALAAATSASTAEGFATASQNLNKTYNDYLTNTRTYMNTARSYATGDSNTRTGEATDNAKYYSQQASTARTASETAKTKAETAQSKAETAQSKAETAQSKAETAQSKAEQAQSAAESAKTDLETARDLAKSYANGTGGRTDEATDNAKYYSQQAASSASAASTSASTASTKAGEASTSANNAHTSETNAATSATNAATSESNASDSATTASTKATDASTSATQAEGFSKDSEAWAVGKRGGIDVESTDDTYENNSKYWAEQSSASATASATNAANMEAWAVGTKNGIAVEPTDNTYNNNAKYWAEQAEQYSYNAQQTAVVSADGTTIEADENGVLSVHPDVLSKDVVASTETDLDLMKTAGKYYLSEVPTNGWPDQQVGASAIRYSFIQVDVEPTGNNNEPIITQTLTLTNTSAFAMIVNRVFTRVWFSESVGWSAWKELTNYGEFYKSLVENSEDADFDNFITPGAYPKVITYNVVHSPGWACHLNVYYYNDYIEQVAIRHANVGMAIRARINGEWTAWNYVTMTTSTT